MSPLLPLVTDTRTRLQNVPGCWQCDNLGLFFRATVRLPTFAKPPFVSRHENAGAFLSTLQTLNTGNRNFSKLCRSSAPPCVLCSLGLLGWRNQSKVRSLGSKLCKFVNLCRYSSCRSFRGMGGGGGVAATDTQISTSELTKDLIIPAKLLISRTRSKKFNNFLDQGICSILLTLQCSLVSSLEVIYNEFIHCKISKQRENQKTSTYLSIATIAHRHKYLHMPRLSYLEVEVAGLLCVAWVGGVGLVGRVVRPVVVVFHHTHAHCYSNNSSGYCSL